MKTRLGIVAVILGIVLSSRPAAADVIITPFVGADFGGDLDSRITCGGAALTWMGHRVGVELDLSYAPDLAAGDLADFFVGSSSLASAMVNLVIGRGGASTVQPFVSGGVGIIRAQAEVGFIFGPSSIYDNRDLGVNVGGGVTGYFHRHFGIRGDFRWFRILAKDNGELFADSTDYYRATAGLAIRF